MSEKHSIVEEWYKDHARRLYMALSSIVDEAAGQDGVITPCEHGYQVIFRITGSSVQEARAAVQRWEREEMHEVPPDAGVEVSGG